MTLVLKDNDVRILSEVLNGGFHGNPDDLDIVREKINVRIEHMVGRGGNSGGRPVMEPWDRILNAMTRWSEEDGWVSRAKLNQHSGVRGDDLNRLINEHQNELEVDFRKRATFFRLRDQA